MEDNGGEHNEVLDRIPGDLVSLPTMPYDQRPAELPLDIEECRTAIWMASGNITDAAKILKVTTIRLRQFVKKSAYLTAEMQESAEQLVDIAEKNVKDALLDEQDPSRRDTMSRFVLTNIGKSRGWGSGNSAGSLNVKNSPGGTLIVQWADGTTFNSKDGNTIDGEVNERTESDAA